MSDDNEMYLDGFLIPNGTTTANIFQHISNPLTLQRMVEMKEEFDKKFSPTPPYYRVNTRTYESLKKMSIPAKGPLNFFASVEIRIDDTVPDGDARPPMGWKR